MIGKNNRLFGAILLISGTTIGAGMLALPVTTGLAGFFPSLVIITVIWLYMMLTAFYFLEVNLRLKGESNFISMMHKTLGRGGEIVSWITYLVLLYALTAAYLVGCSQILKNFFPFQIADWIWPVVVFLLFGLFVYLGTLAVDYLNRFCMALLILSYIAMIAFGLPKINPSLLTYSNWNFVLPSVAVVLTTFGFHIIIPTLTTYLEHEAKLLKRAIFIGSLIPFIVYICWQILVMGVVPVLGEDSLTEASQHGAQVTFVLSKTLNSVWIGSAIQSFAFFAIVTSLLGVSLSLTDFLADGLKIKKSHKGKFILVLLAFVPPLLFALFYQRAFLLALNYAGYCVLILLALLPSLMAWCERYRGSREGRFVKSDFRVPGGKGLLIFSILFAFILFGLRIFG